MDEEDLKHELKPIRIRSESGTEDVHYPGFYESLTEEDIVYAERELNETEANKTKGISHLKEYMERENLTCPDDRILIIVLRHSKYNFKKSESKLKKFLKLRQFTSKKLAQMDMSTIGCILEGLMFVVLPYKDKHGNLIVYTQPSPNIIEYNHEEIVICGIASLLYALSFPMSSIYGAMHIGECSTPHVNLFQPLFKIWKMISSIMNDIPVRLKGLNFVNINVLFRWCFFMVRPLLSEKMKKRINLHGSGFDSVLKIFHPDILPYEVGGTMGPLSIKHYKEGLLCFIEKLREEHLAKDTI